jgi:hypothetical protein
MWKEAVVPWFKVLPRNFLWGIVEHHKTPQCQISLSPGRIAILDLPNTKQEC